LKLKEGNTLSKRAVFEIEQSSLLETKMVDAKLSRGFFATQEDVETINGF